MLLYESEFLGLLLCITLLALALVLACAPEPDEIWWKSNA
ncbi:hypothetical protein EV192_101702 [Actinocrispum wychmicini]|uniref:Uncharacterized protein n=1 Tax=Actinocrispum wychmicini TaxID=1213861 RepID=A0A4R2K554_9PSEU|nr:hypothetical protein EV192_101702 [Actinocrispum wychmicini]